MSYYTLIGLETEELDNKTGKLLATPIKTWVIEFGSYDKEEVVFEKDTCNSEWYTKLKIIKTKTARQSEINKAVRELNEKLEDKRLGRGTLY